MPGRIFVTTDTHGCKKQLKKLLEMVEFNDPVDRLIHLGDCTDRGPDSYGVIDLLNSIKNKICVKGNHDDWITNLANGAAGVITRGTIMTLNSYKKRVGGFRVNEKLSGVSTDFSAKNIPQKHKDFFNSQMDYYVDEQGRLFSHAGYDPLEPIEHQSVYTLRYERELIDRLIKQMIYEGYCTPIYDVNNFKRVFVGHTPSLYYMKKYGEHMTNAGLDGDKPMYLDKLVGLDTGCCFGGKMSLIDITDDENHILYQVDGI